MTLVALLIVAILLVVGHETAHVLTTWACGGRFEGIVVRHILAVAVKIRVDGLSVRQVMATLIAAPMTEMAIIAIASWCDPAGMGWWLVLGAVQIGVNWVPWWGFPNDGQRVFALLQQGRAALAIDN